VVVGHHGPDIDEKPRAVRGFAGVFEGNLDPANGALALAQQIQPGVDVGEGNVLENQALRLARRRRRQGKLLGHFLERGVAGILFTGGDDELRDPPLRLRPADQREHNFAQDALAGHGGEILIQADPHHFLQRRVSGESAEQRVPELFDLRSRELHTNTLQASDITIFEAR
jgi:hypothetical protein